MAADSSPTNTGAITITRLVWKALDWLYPPQCCNCQQGGGVMCENCQSQIHLINGSICQKCGYPQKTTNSTCPDCRTSPPPFIQMRSWGEFSGPLRKALHSLKYKNNLAMGIFFAKSLAEMVRQLGWQIDLVVPVPLSRRHFQQRGYNQASIISSSLAKELSLPHHSHLIKRIKETESQISLDVNKRFTNLMDAFYANPAKLKERKILLVDDVITTGATMQNCTIALQKAGTDQVYCLSVARTILYRSHTS